MVNVNNDVFLLRDKLVAITGGLGLLGRSLTKAFAKSGANVIVVDIDQEAWAEFSEELEQKKIEVSYENIDITEIDKISMNIERLEQKYGNIDVWVNNAYPRTVDWGNKLEQVTSESWRKNVDMQLNSCCVCSNEIAKSMASRGKGCVISVSSVYGITAPDFSIYEGTDMTSPAAYSAIKGGVIAYSKYLASYFGNKGVRVNVVCPGGIYNDQPEEFIKKYSNRTILGKLAEPDEIAWPIVFMATDAASYITGTVLMVDGGWSTM